MATYFDVHPDNPQPRAVAQAGRLLRAGGILAYPTDTTYALGCHLGDAQALDRIRAIRDLDARHHFTLVCRDFAQLSQFVTVDKATFRAVKASTPGPYTFILTATREVPRRLLHDKKTTVGVRIPRDPVAQALLAEMGEPIVSTTLLLPDDSAAMTDGWSIKERLDHSVDGVVDGGPRGVDVSTVVDLAHGEPVIVRRGVGDPSRFEA